MFLTLHIFSPAVMKLYRIVKYLIFANIIFYYINSNDKVMLYDKQIRIVSYFQKETFRKFNLYCRFRRLTKLNSAQGDDFLGHVLFMSLQINKK